MMMTHHASWVVLLLFLLVVVFCLNVIQSSGVLEGKTCINGLVYDGDNLPGSPFQINSTSSNATDICKQQCKTTDGCKAYVFIGNSDGYFCNWDQGDCYMKVMTSRPTYNKCACGEVMNMDFPEPRPSSHAPLNAKNVLYIVVDDLRPELHLPYDQALMNTPHIDKLAGESMVFERAYCQISVCSPSRMSFLSGRRPDITKTYNFINHIRQANCGVTISSKSYTNTTAQQIAVLPVSTHQGGAGQCCTSCTAHGGCTLWTYNSKSSSCHLFKQGAQVPTIQMNKCLTCISGIKGAFASGSANWTTLPQHFKLNGYFTTSTGKIFHTEEGGVGPYPWIGNGMPPVQDPPSWSRGYSMMDVNGVAPMAPCHHGEFRFGCGINATADGVVLDNSAPLCDKTISDDAVSKLQTAVNNTHKSGQPFFLAVGFRKPHLPFRFPAPYLSLYPNQRDIPVAVHDTMSYNVPPIAHRGGTSTQKDADPHFPTNTTKAQFLRLHYYAAASWMDAQVGRVLDELSSSGLDNDTIVVLHSDHGWQLGEHGQWEKFTLWELAARVPLMVRVPWMDETKGKHTFSFAELVDVYPTLVELAGLLPPPDHAPLSGISLVPVLKNSSRTLKNYTLSQYPRCPQDMNNSSLYYESNDCEFVDRTEFPFMGYSLRVDGWRYNEWVGWNGTALSPVWDNVIGEELYAHLPSDINDFDRSENTNLVQTERLKANELKQLLHDIVDNELSQRTW
eukprot:m.20779 g.20779  ORF g.20779 m.20779 type:complete len:732 (-) comp8620_c0_seq2:146-2341(-)